MRAFALSLLLMLTPLIALSMSGARMAHAAAATQDVTAPRVLMQEDATADDDDDLVEVQLVVLGGAAFTVVGVGTAAYFIRKRLGLVAGPPEQGADGHH
jgi:hypothetical protein